MNAGDLVGFGFIAALTLGILWTFWSSVRAFRRREFRLYGVSVTPDRYPVGFWVAMLIQLIGVTLVAVFVAKTFWIPIILHRLLR